MPDPLLHDVDVSEFTIDATYPGGGHRTEVSNLHTIDGRVAFDVDRYDVKTGELEAGIVVVLTRHNALELGLALLRLI